MPVDSKGGITFPQELQGRMQRKSRSKRSEWMPEDTPPTKLRGNPRRNILLGKSIGEVEESFLIKTGREI
ncbi:MAG: hypothetical protein QXK32_04965 [Candidatus Jordarchaeales archaeon]